MQNEFFLARQRFESQQPEGQKAVLIKLVLPQAAQLGIKF